MRKQTLSEILSEADSGNFLAVNCRGNCKGGSITFWATDGQQDLMENLATIFHATCRDTEQTSCCKIEFDTTQLSENKEFEPTRLPENQEYVLWAYVSSEQLFLYGPESMGDLITQLAHSIGIPQTEFDESTHTIGFSVEGKFEPTQDANLN